MGLRCLIGHEYGDPQTSRERHQRGNEVVVTVQEYRECSRCGHRRIISENKEVTADEPPEPEPEQAPAPDEAWSTDPPADGAEPADGLGLDPVAMDEPLTAEEDDGVILEDESAEPGRAYGEWPEAGTGVADGDAVQADHDPWPDQGPEPAGTDPFDPEAQAGAEGQATSPPEGPADASAGVAEPTGATGGGASETPTPPPDPTDTELACPECGDSWPSMNVSLRPGDICPECHAGYLEEQVVH